MRLVLLAVVVVLAGCATTLDVRDVDATGAPSGTNVLKLSDYPANRDYRTLATIEIKAYKAGLSQPTADDVWDEISKAVASRGGNACLLRGQKSDDLWARRVWVTCEVLSVSDLRR